MKRLIIGLALVTAIGLGSLASAQTTCPDTYTCLDYQDHVIEVDPAQGPMQAIVVGEQLTRVKDLNGTRETRTVTILAVVEFGEQFVLKGELVEQQDGLFEGAKIGDVFVLAKAP